MTKHSICAAYNAELFNSVMADPKASAIPLQTLKYGAEINARIFSTATPLAGGKWEECVAVNCREVN